MEPTYFALVKIVGGIEFALAVGLYFRDLGSWRLPLFAYLLAEATSNLIPIALRDPLWWRYAWMPLCFLRVGLATVESFELALRAYNPFRKDRDEKRRLLACMIVGTVVLIFAAWTWTPENHFQALDVVNEYARLALLFGFSSIWFWLYMTQGAWPLVPSLTRAQARWWVLWLLTMFANSTKAKGGLLWHLFRWQGGYRVWLICGVACLTAQAALLIAFSLRFLREGWAVAWSAADR